ncbi:MAG: cytochrome P450 [Solirubrobacterales bacterium]|nr:cytochrome P450 [Solirubrobacterales bacterium]
MVVDAGRRELLPPGPPLPSTVQALAWALRPLEVMDRCYARYGNIFTLRVRRGRPWVFLTQPEHVKEVFTTDSELLRAGAGEANPLLGPLLGPRSVMLLDEPQHLSDRRRLLPSFHAQRMKAYGAMMGAVAEEQIERWPLGEPFALWPRMQAISLEVVMHSVFDGIHSMLERAHAVDGEWASEEKMRDELVTMLSDGPTATSLAWVFERLLRHPEKLERLRAELLAEEGEEYLDAVVKETLRLCPAVPIIMRRLTEPMHLGAYTLPAETIVAPCIYLLHRRADIYPDPLSFRPERFLEESAGTYSWIPFGGGVRRCVAVSFAQLEMREVMNTVLRELDLRPAAASSEGAARSSVSFAPDGGAIVLASRRMREALA